VTPPSLRDEVVTKQDWVGNEEKWIKKCKLISG
jgi:hypothetical protein